MFRFYSIVLNKSISFQPNTTREILSISFENMNKPNNFFFILNWNLLSQFNVRKPTKEKIRQLFVTKTSYFNIISKSIYFWSDYEFFEWIYSLEDD